LHAIIVNNMHRLQCTEWRHVTQMTPYDKQCSNSQHEQLDGLAHPFNDWPWHAAGNRLWGPPPPGASLRPADSAAAVAARHACYLCQLTIASQKLPNCLMVIDGHVPTHTQTVCGLWLLSLVLLPRCLD